MLCIYVRLTSRLLLLIAYLLIPAYLSGWRQSGRWLGAGQNFNVRLRHVLDQNSGLPQRPRKARLRGLRGGGGCGRGVWGPDRGGALHPRGNRHLLVHQTDVAHVLLLHGHRAHPVRGEFGLFGFWPHGTGELILLVLYQCAPSFNSTGILDDYFNKR